MNQIIVSKSVNKERRLRQWSVFFAVMALLWMAIAVYGAYRYHNQAEWTRFWHKQYNQSTIK